MELSALRYYLTNFEFYSDVRSWGPSIQQRRQRAAAAMYAMLCLGIFARQVVVFKPLGVDIARATFATAAGSLMVGLAVLPPAMRFISRRKRVPSWEHAVSAYAIGFAIDMSLGFSIARVAAAIRSIG